MLDLIFCDCWKIAFLTVFKLIIPPWFFKYFDKVQSAKWFSSHSSCVKLNPTRTKVDFLKSFLNSLAYSSTGWMSIFYLEFIRRVQRAKATARETFPKQLSPLRWYSARTTTSSDCIARITKMFNHLKVTITVECQLCVWSAINRLCLASTPVETIFRIAHKCSS